MASETPSHASQILAKVLRFLRIFTLNLWRRLIMLWHYSVICLHQQRFRRACRQLGARVFASLEAGEVNPMLVEEVKDSVDKAQALKRLKDRHYEALAALRQKIKAAWSGEAAPEAPEEQEEK